MVWPGLADPGVLLGSLELLNGTQLINNTAQLLGGAVAAPLLAGFMLSGGSMLNNNTSVSGAGGAIAEASAVDASVIVACQYLPSSSQWSIEGGSIIHGNTAGAGPGGALLLAARGQCSTNNSHPVMGQQLHANSLHLEVHNASIAGNRACVDPASCLAGTVGGGAIAVVSPGTGSHTSTTSQHFVRALEVLVGSSELLGNHVGAETSSGSQHGGAVLLVAQPTTSGGQCRAQVFNNTVVQHNTARGDGGAVAVQNCQLAVRGAVMDSNGAGGGGGAVAVSASSGWRQLGGSSLGVAGQDLLDVKTDGGSPSAYPWLLAITNSSFMGNTAAKGAGGALLLTASLPAEALGEVRPLSTAGLLSLVDSSFNNNSALEGGGGACSASAAAAAVATGSNNSSSAILLVDSCSFTGNQASGAGGALEILAAASRCGNRVVLYGSMGNVTAAGNMAGGSGGAIAVVQQQDSMADSCGSAYLQTPSQGSLSGSLHADGLTLMDNLAAAAGGGMYTSGSLSLDITAAKLHGNRAAGGPGGGGLTVINCTTLELTSSSLEGNRAAAGSGGGLHVSNCGRVLLQQTTVVGNQALSGGGVHVDSTRDAGGLNSPQLPSTAAPARVLASTAQLLANGDSAGQQPAVLMGTAFIVHQATFQANTAFGGRGSGGPTSSAATTEQGRGGAVYITGLVAAALYDADFSGGNMALSGLGIASTQQCGATQDSSVWGLDYPQLASASVDVDAALSGTWLALEKHLKMANCYPLALLGHTRLAVPQLDTQDQGQQVHFQVWFQESSAAVLFVSCLPDSGSPVTTTTPGLGPSPSAASQDVGTGKDATAVPALFTALADCLPTGTQPDNRMLDSLVRRQPSTIKLLSMQQAGAGLLVDSSTAGIHQWDVPRPQVLSLRPGLPFSTAAQLYDSLGIPVTYDGNSEGLLLLDIEPLDNGNQPEPWFPNLTRVDPGFSSLTQQVTRGQANWRQLVAFGWPGDYRLLFKTSAPGVSSLEYGIVLLPCALGEALVSGVGLTGGQPSWTSCQPCTQDTFLLWQDTRPHLGNISFLSQMVNTSKGNTSNGTLLAYMGQIVASLLSSGEATCRGCPAAAQCPGGAILVPQPGWWHSAANSTQMHQCPYQAACGGSAAVGWEHMLNSTGDTDSSPTGTGLSMLKDGRSKALAHCQSAWYAAAQHPGATAADTTRSEARPDSPTQLCYLWHGNSSTSDLEPSSFAPISYAQLQCAAGYTGNLCAACQPGYYASAGFQCSQCPSVAQTAGRGVLTFLGGTALVIVTTYTNLWADYAHEDQGQGAGAADILKTLIVHIQHLVIVTRLSIQYPDSVLVCSAFLRAITAAGEWFGFSPSCLVPGQSSSGQAAARLMGGILIPMAVAATSLVLWCARYCLRQAGKVPRLYGRHSTLIKTDSKQPARQAEAVVSATTSTQQLSSTQLGSRASSDAAVPVLSHGLLGPAVPSDAVVIALYAGSGRYCDLPPYSPSPFADPSAQQCPNNNAEECRRQQLGQQQVCTQLSSQQPVSSIQQTQQWPSQQPREQEQNEGLLTGQGQQQVHQAPQQQQQHHVAPALQARVSLVNTLSHVLSGTSRTFSQLRLAPAPSSALAHMDRSLPLLSQLGVVLLVAVFVLYPTWVQASLGIFACYTIDDGTGLYPQNQKATWHYGYWVQNMKQPCYSGVHLRAYVPVGVVCVLVLCMLPPLASFLVLWSKRSAMGRARGQLDDPLQHDVHVQQTYGFLYRSYRPRYWWWASAAQLLTLVLVAAEVFGRALPVQHQALLLQAMLLVVAFISTACSPLRSRQLVVLEFASFCVLGLTITLGLYFAGDEALSALPREAIGVIILALNIAMLVAFGLMLLWTQLPLAKRLARKSWLWVQRRRRT